MLNLCPLGEVIGIHPAVVLRNLGEQVTTTGPGVETSPLVTTQTGFDQGIKIAGEFSQDRGDDAATLRTGFVGSVVERLPHPLACCMHLFPAGELVESSKDRES